MLLAPIVAEELPDYFSNHPHQERLACHDLVQMFRPKYKKMSCTRKDNPRQCHVERFSYLQTGNAQPPSSEHICRGNLGASAKILVCMYVRDIGPILKALCWAPFLHYLMPANM